MDPIGKTSPVMILAAADVGEQWCALLATPNRTISLFSNHSDLIYMIAQIEPTLIIVDDETAVCSPELLSTRINGAGAVMPPATLVIAKSDRVAAIPMDPDSGPFDYLADDCSPSMLRAKVALLLSMQRQQQMFYSSLRELDRLNQQH